MKMIKTITGIMLIFMLAGCATTKANPDEVSLNTAIRDAASRMEARLPKGTRVALINFTSPSQIFSEYVLDELSSVLVNSGELVVVDRANLDRIRQELGFNASGEVSDASAQEIGKMLGAQAVVTGSYTSIADLRRVMFKVIITESAEVVVQHNADIANDRRVQTLIAQGGGSRGVSYGTQGAGAANTASGRQSSSGNTTQGRQPATTYRIGDTGPAGGLVFYDKGNSIGGWRYLEAAPTGLGPTTYISNPGAFPPNLYQLWERTYESSGRAVGRGISNTEHLMQIAQAVGGFNWAVRLCDNYELNGFDDWFLPSRDELNFIYGNLYLKGLGNYRQEQYWSSTGWTDTWGSYRAWYINFADGAHDTVNAGQQRRVIPVRQF